MPGTMMKWEWERSVTNVNRYNKGINGQDRARLMLSTLFLLFLTRVGYLAVVDRESLDLQVPFFGSWSMLSGLTSFTTVPPKNLEDEPSIKGTSIVGRKAVEKFRNHLDCFSESGKWVYDSTPRHIPWNYVADPYLDACERRHKQLAESSGYDHVFGDLADDIAMGKAAGNWSSPSGVREELKWVWQTNSSCPWRSINRDQFCRKIGAEGHVMIVGDSINNGIQWSLMNALITNGSTNQPRYQRLDGSSRFSIGPYEMCSDILGNGQGFNVSFICNVHLTIVNDLNDPLLNIKHPWIDVLDDYHTKILLLNRGAHYADDEQLANGLRDVFTILTRRYPHIHVIYRNTQPGHADCMKLKEPLGAPQQGSLPYHWDEFNRQNLLTRKIVEEFEYTYMDASTMLALRPDAHISEEDCLHYCIPGPLDIAPEYLYNILLLL